MKLLEQKLTDNAALQKQLVTYAKTRATYLAYRKSGYSKAFKQSYEADILLHQTEKKFFDELRRPQRFPSCALRMLQR